MSLSDCAHLTASMVGFWAIVSALEWILNARLARADGALCWSIISLRGSGRASALKNMLIGSTGTFYMLQLGRLAAGVILISSSSDHLRTIALFMTVLSAMHANYRMCFGGDGSDQMGLIVAIGALLMAIGSLLNDAAVSCVAIMLVAGQACLAYFFSGASKLISPVWRSGAAVNGVMNTETFGHPWAGRLTLQRPSVSLFTGWIVMSTEAVFPTLLLLPPEPFLLALCAFAFFHLVNGVFMGLNSFIPSFLATYPSLIAANTMIAGQLWLQ